MTNANLLSPNIRAPLVRKGEPIRASDISRIADIVNRASTFPISQSSQSQGLGVSLRVQRFEIVEVRKDYTLCAPLNGGALSSVGEALVAVAKPFLIRGSQSERLLQSGPVTYTYTNSSFTARTAVGTETENQVVHPEYVPQDEIMAIYYPDGFDLQDLNDSEAQLVAWIEIETRTWAKV